MDRKLNKKELDLWKEVTKEDIKINNYISEDMIESNINILNKKPTTAKKTLPSDKKKNKELKSITNFIYIKFNTFLINLKSIFIMIRKTLSLKIF